jgi:glycosyltransferase involved in cell wall biosynthesis
LIDANYDLRLSLFCYDIIPETNGEGVFDYADPFASRIEPYVKRIFTDNNVEIDELVTKYGFDRRKIKTHFQPFVEKIEEPKKRINSGKLHILWASRICTQKRPELVIDIAKQLDPDKYCIDMYGKMDSQYDKNMFSGINTLKYCGSFNGLSSININQYDCFLYTSFIDGLPNTILEVASKGLPIVASNAGGIKDFIKNNKTGILVKDKDTSAYVDALKFIRDNPERAEDLSNNARGLLKKRHSWSSFLEEIKEDF